MRKRTVALFVILVGLMGLVPYETHGKEPLYHLTQVTDARSAKACADAGGLGAMVFTLDSDGNPDRPIGAACVTPAK